MTMRVRPFRNNDPPGLAEVWRSQPPQRGLAQGISAELLEELVFSRQYFDRDGLLVAEESGRPIAFAHAGFGPAGDESTLSREVGVICLVLVMPRDDRSAVAAALLEEAEHYLRERGAQRIEGGGHPPRQPFYLGLYGGASLPGILDSDPVQGEFFRARGYEAITRRVVWQARLRDLRAPVTRQMLALKRRHSLAATLDPPAESWWEACALATSDRSQFRIGGPNDTPRGRVVYWEMRQFSHTWGTHACGLQRLEAVAASDAERPELLEFLLGESLRQLKSQGVSLVEAHIDEGAAEARLLAGLGFTEVDRGTVWSTTPRTDP